MHICNTFSIRTCYLEIHRQLTRFCIFVKQRCLESCTSFISCRWRICRIDTHNALGLVWFSLLLMFDLIFCCQMWKIKNKLCTLEIECLFSHILISVCLRAVERGMFSALCWMYADVPWGKTSHWAQTDFSPYAHFSNWY